jgi:truncated hemoglobin YjbI
VTDLDRVGADRVGRVIDALVRREAADWVIGFLFEGADLDAIVAHETALAINHLGGTARYGGRPLGAVHRPKRINRGHFRRRMALLRQQLEVADIPDDVASRWLAHDSALEGVVTNGTDCTAAES